MGRNTGEHGAKCEKGGVRNLSFTPSHLTRIKEKRETASALFNVQHNASVSMYKFKIIHWQTIEIRHIMVMGVCFDRHAAGQTIFVRAFTTLTLNFLC